MIIKKLFITEMPKNTTETMTYQKRQGEKKN